MKEEGKLKKAEVVAKQAGLLVSVLAVAKAMIGFASGSLVLISDAIHSASDLVSVFASWFGLKISQREPDERFPYGYYKAENLATAVVSVLILFASWEIFTEGLSRLQALSPIKIPLLALGISLIDALVLFLFGKYEVRVGKEANSRSLVAMGEENKTHLFSSLAVSVGILSAYYQIPYIEGLVTIALSLLILKIGLSAARDSIFALMDVSPSSEIEERVIEGIEEVPGIEEYFDLRLRKAGPFIFGETKVGVRKYIDVKRAHEIADGIETKIKEKVPQVDSFSVHIEPYKGEFRHLVIPVMEKKGLDSPLSGQFGRAPYFLFVNLKGKKVKGHYLLDNPHRDQKMRAGLAASKMIIERKSEVLITREIGEISFYTLRDNLFDLYRAKGEKAKTAIEHFIKGELEPLAKPTVEKV